ncbi:MAG TPA: tryptophan synthase subunit alpha [Bacteroidia bacterium]|nr:tryptophan synthase subunit alpha [Bacteroidia bacterium]
MNRIDRLFEKKKKDVLAVYFTAGYPNLNDTVSIISALGKEGTDLIEIGMPFSDPLADGPVIQESSRIALENGMNIKLLFEQLSKLPRAAERPPLILMGYLNPVMQFGIEKFLQKCAEAGISGIILPDMPVEVYEREYKVLFEKYGIHFIFLITPVTPELRARKIASLSKGFLYLVSTSATTGTNNKFSDEQEASLKKVADYNLPIPILTGFGIHDHDSFKAASRFTNGAIVGSAFIRELAKTKNPETASRNLITRLQQFNYDHSVK